MLFKETLSRRRESPHFKQSEAHAMGKGVNEASEKMMLLLKELAVLKKTGSKGPSDTKRRREISREMKRLAGQKEKTSSRDTLTRISSPNP
jgi:hypothetical protein